MGELLGGTGGGYPNSALLVEGGSTHGVKALAYGGQWVCAGLAYAGSSAGLVFDLTVLPVSPSLAPPLINGNLAVTGTVAVVVRNGHWPSAGTYPLVSNAGTLSGPGSFVLAALPAGVEATLVNNTGDKRLDLSVIRRLFINGVLKTKDTAYGPATLPTVFTGSSDAYLLTTDGAAVRGALLQVR